MTRPVRTPKPPSGTDIPTVPFHRGATTPQPEPRSEHRFLPGTRFGDRYRIVELLGRGGMGEVYRADDLQLGQTVALKFLPRELTDDAAALARLRNEVRVARGISHPNICRVWDIGEAEGCLFLSMEYIDGEDLGSVLRRLGRPTREKAMEIARQLCAGLAAAHEAGVLHRDLKPDNVMIDGRGRVRITDFGLATFARELSTAAQGGTPAYMAPEMFRGAAASARTDIFALGIVLYEMFTGRRAFVAKSVVGIRKLHEERLQRPSEIIPEIEPVAEEIVMRCLDTDPTKRPLNALAVAAVLPGQDLVAAALAAGQTPSPETVAAAGGLGALRLSTAIACLVSIVAGILLIAGLNRRVALHGLVPPSTPTVALAAEARKILERLGYSDTPHDTAYGWEIYHGYLRHVESTDTDVTRWDRLGERRPPVWWLWYRESPVSLVPRNRLDGIRFGDPAASVPEMAGLKLDDRGRLAVLTIVPPQVAEATDRNDAVDYSGLFEAAGLDPADFSEVEPERNPPHYADSRAAWTGHYPDQPGWPVRVEAAAYAGRPVHFNVLETFDTPWTGPDEDKTSLAKWSVISIEFGLLALGFIAPPVLARRNLRRGTGDRHGAVRLGIALFVLGMLAWALSSDHVASFRAETEQFLVGLGLSLLMGFWGGLVYLGLEPYARRLLPDAMISWTRLLMGRITDPRVGRDVLIGALAGVLVIVVQRLEWLVPPWFGVAPTAPFTVFTDALDGGRKAWALFINDSTLRGPLVILLALMAALYVVRRRWVAVLIVFVVFAVADNHLVFEGPAVIQITRALEVVLVYTIILFTMMRFGLLALFASFFFFNVLQSWPLVFDTSVWFSGTSLTGMIVLTAIAALATRTSYRGQVLA